MTRQVSFSDLKFLPTIKENADYEKMRRELDWFFANGSVENRQNGII